MYTVGEFMTKKDDLHVVKPTTTVDEGITHVFNYKFELQNDCYCSQELMCCCHIYLILIQNKIL